MQQVSIAPILIGLQHGWFQLDVRFNLYFFFFSSVEKLINGNEYLVLYGKKKVIRDLHESVLRVYAVNLYSLSVALLSFVWSTWPLSARSLRSFCSCASTRSRSRRSRSCSAATWWCLASCCFRYRSRCSLAANSCRCDSIWCCCRHAISSSSRTVSSVPGSPDVGNWNENRKNSSLWPMVKKNFFPKKCTKHQKQFSRWEHF